MTAFGGSVWAKLGTQRKQQEYLVMPIEDGERIVVQSDKSIGIFNFRTGKGLLNQKGSYFPHLSPALGAKAYTFPAEFVAQCLKQCPTLDGATDIGGVIVQHNIEVV